MTVPNLHAIFLLDSPCTACYAVGTKGRVRRESRQLFPPRVKVRKEPDSPHPRGVTEHANPIGSIP